MEPTRPARAALMCALLGVAACSTDRVSSVEVTSVALGADTATLVVGEFRNFSVTVRDQDGNAVPPSIVEWFAGPVSVLAVEGPGRVRAVGPGEGTVRATAQGLSATARLTVRPGPTIRVSEGAVDLVAAVGGTPNLEPTEVRIDNAGAGTLSGLVAEVSYPAGGPAAWLTPTLEATTAPTLLRLAASPAGLAAGEYGATVHLASPAASNSPVEIAVRFRVGGDAPLMRATPALVAFSGVAGGTRPPAQAIAVENAGGGALEDLEVALQYEDGDGWLSALLSGEAAPATLTLRTDPALLPPGTYRARARLTSATALNSPLDVIAVLQVGAIADLRAFKAGPDSAAAGTRVPYGLWVRNEGPSAAEGVVVTDTLPGEGVVGIPPGAVLEAGVLRWSIGTLPAGAERRFQVEVDLPPDALGSVRNVMGVESATPPPDGGAARHSQTTARVYASADLGIDVRPPASGLVAGAQATYHLVVHNRGPSDAAGVVVTDTLPVGFDFVSADGGAVRAHRVVRWPPASLRAGDSLGVAVTVAVPPDASGTAVNVGTVDADTPDPEAGDDVDIDRSTILVPQPLADLVVAAEAPAVAYAGTRIATRLVVRNLGPEDAREVVLVDSLPAGAAVVSASDGGVAAEGAVTWPTIPTLAVGDSLVRTLELDLDPAVTGIALQVARVGATSRDPDPVDDRVEVATSVSLSANLAVKLSGPTATTSGGTVTWTVEVANEGPSVATGVAVSDTLPDGVAFVPGDDGATVAGGVVTWPTLDTLAVGASVTLTVTAVVDRTTTGTLRNVAAVSSTSPDPHADDDVAAVSTSLPSPADLSLTLFGPATATAGTDITWSLRVVNIGPARAEGMVLTDTLPDGVTFVSANRGGAHADGVVTWPASDLGARRGRSYSVVVRIGDGVAGPLSTVGVVVSDHPDPDPDDNRASAVTIVSPPAPPPGG